MATHSSILAWRIPMDYIIHRVTKSQTRPSNFQFHFHFHSSASVLGVLQFSSVQLLSCVRLFCNTMDYNTPGFPVHHQLPELAQTHVYLVSDAIQPSHSLSSPSPPTFNHSSIRVFSNESGGQSIGVLASTSVLPVNTQD